ncbi:MAG: hypothetical protein WD046_05050, partial [Paracoccaceae bacterium]
MAPEIDELVASLRDDGENFGRFAALRKAVPVNAFDAVLLQIQDSHASILPIAFFELARRHDNDELFARYSKQIAAFESSDSYASIRRIWNAFSKLEPLPEEPHVSHWKMRLFLTMELRQYTCVLLDENVPESPHYCVRSLREIHRFFKQSKLPGWEQHINEIGHFDERRKREAVRIEQPSWFQNSIVASGIFELYEIDRFRKTRGRVAKVVEICRWRNLRVT